MNKRIVYILIFLSVTIAIVASLILISISKKDKLLIGNNKLNNNYFKICTLSEDETIYSNFEEIKYVDKSKKIYSLGEALKDNIISFDYILSKGKLSDELNDGGTKIYAYNNNFTNKNVVIVKCHSIIDKNGQDMYVKDIYILDNNPKDALKSFDTICKER